MKEEWRALKKRIIRNFKKKSPYNSDNKILKIIILFLLSCVNLLLTINLRKCVEEKINNTINKQENQQYKQCKPNIISNKNLENTYYIILVRLWINEITNNIY